jgi:hypothetical protein
MTSKTGGVSQNVTRAYEGVRQMVEGDKSVTVAQLDKSINQLRQAISTAGGANPDQTSRRMSNALARIDHWADQHDQSEKVTAADRQKVASIIHKVGEAMQIPGA